MISPRIPFWQDQTLSPADLNSEKPLYASINKVLARIAILDFYTQLRWQRFYFSNIGFIQITLFGAVDSGSLEARFAVWGLYKIMEFLVNRGVMRETLISFKWYGNVIGRICLAAS